MKKTIEHLVKKTGIDSAGSMKGGFGAIRGGLSPMLVAANGSCVNEITCAGSNTAACINIGDCSSATNDATAICSNPFTCKPPQ